MCIDRDILIDALHFAPKDIGDPLLEHRYNDLLHGGSQIGVEIEIKVKEDDDATAAPVDGEESGVAGEGIEIGTDDCPLDAIVLFIKDGFLHHVDGTRDKIGRESCPDERRETLKRGGSMDARPPIESIFLLDFVLDFVSTLWGSERNVGHGSSESPENGIGWMREDHVSCDLDHGSSLFFSCKKC